MMLPRRNMMRGVFTTMAMCILLLTGRESFAHAGLSESQARDAYERLAAWVTAFATPDPDHASAQVAIDDASALCVVLRLRGRVVGIGEDARGDSRMLRRAAGRALSQVLGDAAIIKLPEELRADIGERLTIELEIASRPAPVPGRTFGRIAQQIEPGLEGVAMRRGETWNYLFPAAMRASNLAGRIEQILPSLAVDLGMPAKPLVNLTREFGVQMYRFETLHLVQRAPGRDPRVSYRGQTNIPLEEQVTRDAAIALGDGLVIHLVQSLWPGEEPLGVRGDFLVSTGRYEPLIAPPPEQALVAFALASYANTPGVGSETSLRAREAAMGTLADLAVQDRIEQDPLESLDACAFLTYAVNELPEANDIPELRDLANGALTRLHRQLADPDAMRTINPHTCALVIGALVANASTANDETGAVADSAALTRAIDDLWARTPEPEQVALLPWIAWAEFGLPEEGGRSPERVDHLKRLRERLEAGRIEAGPPDLLGGLALRRDGRNLADAQSTRPAVFLGWSIGEPSLVPPTERAKACEGYRSTLRFLIQLAVEDSLLWMYQSPHLAIGGLRAAAWDGDQPLPAQAMGLLCVSEALSHGVFGDQRGPEGQ